MPSPSRTSFHLFIALALSTAAVQTASRSVWAGVFTQTQANDGEVLFGEYCANCHGDDLGGVEEAPALVGGPFGETWKGATLRKMFDRVESMPPSKPKSLTGKQYADILAYMLSADQLPAGDTALGVDRSALAQIVYSRVRPER